MTPEEQSVRAARPQRTYGFEDWKPGSENTKDENKAVSSINFI